MLCTAISVALCGMTPLQATDNTDLEQAVIRQVSAQRPLRSKEDERFTRKMVSNLLKAHKGHVEEALEDFAGAPIFHDSPFMKYPQIHAIYVAPNDMNRLWVVYSAWYEATYSGYAVNLGRIKRDGKLISPVSGYSFKDKVIVFSNLEANNLGPKSALPRQLSVDHWWKNKDACPTANIGTLITMDMEYPADFTATNEIKWKFDDFSACNPGTLFRVYADVTDFQHLYVIEGNNFRVRLTDYWAGDISKGGQHVYLEFPESANDNGWQERAVNKLSGQAMLKGNWLLWKNNN